jgi:hypothetical protein
MHVCFCNMYKYLLLEFIYTMCVNVLYDYLFVYLLEMMGCSSCCVMVFNSCNTENIEL